MKTLTLKNIFDQKRLPFHLMIILISFIIPVILSIGTSGTVFTEFQINLFVLLVVQLELFILIAGRIFRGLKPGTTRKELTKAVLLRFSLFMGICFVTALIINVVSMYILSLIHGSYSTDVISNFLQYGFRAWFKATVGGLLFGAAIFIFVQWQDALTREQKLREENLIFQNETLKNQVNPHFLFNSLNTLSSLIATHPDTAERFIGRLSSIYRYILENSQKDKVALQSELAFISDYFDLHKINEAGFDFIKASELGDKNASELVEIMMKYPKKTE